MKFENISVDSPLPSTEFSCSTVQLFLYNAVLFNAHLIHYDRQYAREVEGYEDLVVAGPLIGDWLHQCVENWLGESGRVVGMEYSNRHAAYVDERLVGGGMVRKIDAARQEIEVDVFIKNNNDDVIAPGVARVQFGNVD